MWKFIGARFFSRKLYTIQDGTVFTPNPDGTMRKHICGLFNQPSGPQQLITLLSQKSGLQFHWRDSDMRFGGGDFCTGSDGVTSVYIVPAPQLFWHLPWYVPKRGWWYVHVICEPTNTSFDDIQAHTFIPTAKHITI